ncbi:ABC transporter permease [Paraburkholderia sp. J67]|uniref:ABC transporter permease n=1 Tax=Paraburkholderia sp. J67 TaxID=2805435 RepID=UPI002ABDE12B|nr:ABC transporter permease [Paraburkholderia sp. J67]
MGTDQTAVRTLRPARVSETDARALPEPVAHTPAPAPALSGAWRIAGALLPVAFLLAVEGLVRAHVLPDNLVPAPSSIAEALWQLGAEHLLRHIAASTARVAAGFGIGALLAIAIGAAMGLSRRLDALLDPSFQALRAIPSLAWVPVLLLWMGIDEAPKITLVAIGAFFPVHLSVVSGIRNVDRKLVELGAIYRLPSWRLFLRILLPAALPQIFTGLRMGLAVSWMFVVAAELIAATRGLGYLLSDGRETGRPDIVFGAIILLGLLGKLTDSALRALEARVLAWRDTAVEGESA